MPDWIGYRWLIERFGLTVTQALRTETVIGSARATVRDRKGTRLISYLLPMIFPSLISFHPLYVIFLGLNRWFIIVLGLKQSFRYQPGGREPCRTGSAIGG